MATKRYNSAYKKYCCVYGCLNKTNKEAELSFFNVPKDIERVTEARNYVLLCYRVYEIELKMLAKYCFFKTHTRREWLTAIDRTDLLDEETSKTKYNYVCSVHFEDSAIITTISKRLTNDAVPTKFLPHKGDKNIKLDARSGNLSSHLSKKNYVLVSTYSHTQCQTEPQGRKVLSHEKEIESEITKPNVNNNQLNKLKQKSTMPSQISPIIVTEPTIGTPQSQANLISSEKNKIKKSNTPSTSAQIDLDQTSNTQTTTALSEKSPTRRKRKMKKVIEIGECKRTRLKQELLEIHKELEPKNSSLLSDSEDEVAQNTSLPSDSEDEVVHRCMKLVEWQSKFKNKFKGKRYDSEYKTFALKLYYASPHAYRSIQTILKLPSKSTLSRLKLKIPPKLDARVLDILSLKIKSLPANAKYCTICIDDMVLKRHLYYDTKNDELIGFHNINGTISPEIANNAYVIMLQGIYCNWKQPVAYALLGSIEHYAELDSWINDVILKLVGVGIEVKAIISNQERNFDKYAKVVKNVTVDKPYFFVDEHKIFYIFDVPHLLKCVRNNLLSRDFDFIDDRISWDYIKILYEHQKNKNLKLIPKITNAHVEPNKIQREGTNYAAQMFSNTVYAALETYIDFGIIGDEARGTVKFIKVMNDLFDVLNSSKIKSAKKYQSAFRMTTEQKSILQDAQDMFATIEMTNRNKSRAERYGIDQITTFQNFQITIQSVLQLFEDLKSEGFQYLLTRRLNQESMEKYFGFIRQQQGGSCSEPTPIQFTRAFSQLFCDNMLKSDETNCETDIYEILHKAEDIIINKDTLNLSDQAKPSLVSLSGEIDYRIDLPEENALAYVAGFILFKCSKKHPNCKEMFGTLNDLLKLDQQYKAYNKNTSFYGNLKMSSKEMYEYIKKLEAVFTHNFEHHLHGNIGSEIFKLLQKIPLPTLPCSCFPVDYLLRLFVRIRIFSTLRYNNKNLKSEKKSIKQYLKLKEL